jgi:pimeloyl-ACP methyl ester carboxylesterase
MFHPASLTLVPRPGHLPLLSSLMRMTLRVATSFPSGQDVRQVIHSHHEHTAIRDVLIPVGDTMTAGVLMLPPQAEVTRVPAVFLAHGTSAATPWAYIHYIRALLRRGVGVLFVELDGHASHPRALTGPGLAQTAGDSLRWLSMQPEVDADRLATMGISLGGSCALNASATTGLARAVALISTPVRVRMPSGARLREFVTTLNPEALEGFRVAPPHVLLRGVRGSIRVASDAHERGFFEIDILHGLTEPVIDDAIQFLNPLDSAARIRDTPTVFVNGNWDRIAPAEQAFELGRQFKGPTEHLLVPRRNHFTVMTHQRVANEVGDLMLRWLSR